ncbi:MAG: hypothetical protein IV086_16915 [Hyphomonadaceae bacterium]|nr:hypothetical protein [Hyphomonadaceae bacterium]
MVDEAAEPKGKWGARLARWAAASGVALTAIASIAAAISAYSSLQALKQVQETQLLDQRVAACFDLDRRAAAQIVASRDSMREYIQGVLSDRPTGYRYYGYTPYSDGPSFSCAGTVAEQAACEERRQAWRESIPRLQAELARLQQENALTQFNAQRVFPLLGSPALADAELQLNLSLNALAAAGSDYERLAANNNALVRNAMDAQSRFVNACEAAVGAYRAPAAPTPSPPD